MKRTITTLTAVLLISTAGLGASQSAFASTDTAQATNYPAQIDDLLRTNPGGTQTGPNTITWEGGAVELRLAPDGASRAVGTCPTGSFCAFSSTNLAGSRVSFTTCSTHSVGSLIGTAKSIANARTSGTVYGENSSGSVLSTIGANGRVNAAPANVTQLGCAG